MVSKRTDIPPNRYRESVDFRLRLPDSLHAKAKTKAKADGQSLNTWLCDAIEQKLAGTQRSTDPGKRLDRIEYDVREIKKQLKRLER